MKSPAEQLEILKRGCFEILNEEDLLKKLEKSVRDNKPLVVKLGADPTKPDLHLGHTVVLRKMRQFQQLGHTVVFLIGDYTAKIGDPSGKSETRPQLSDEEIRVNALTYRDQFSKILDPVKTQLRFNGEWLAPMTFADTLRLASKYTVARILERDDFSKRFKAGRPIGVHEFLYPLMQGYDSVALHADVELGGTDQKFNLLVGRELQKDYGQESQVVMTMPILAGLDGVQKMSKSLGNYIGISEAPNEMFGKTMSIPDALLFQYLELLTDLPMEEIAAMKRAVEAGANPRDAKVRLAVELISFYHCADAARDAKERFERVFSRKEIPDEMPTVELPAAALKEGKLWLVKTLKDAGLVNTSGEGKRAIAEGAVRVDGEKATSEERACAAGDTFVIQVGKRRFARIVIAA